MIKDIVNDIYFSTMLCVYDMFLMESMKTQNCLKEKKALNFFIEGKIHIVLLNDISINCL